MKSNKNHSFFNEIQNSTISKNPTKPKILFATTNDHKIRIFDIAWKNSGLNQKFELITLNDLPKIELGYIAVDSGTFAGDALLKAQAYTQAYNLPTISQDRGFVFDVLNWPGTDSKKVFTLDETHEFKKGKWNAVKDEYFERAKEILAKIDGLDRSMSVIQGLAVCLPSGEYLSEEFITKGQASSECKVSISGFGVLFGWFFVPEGTTKTISELPTKEEVDQYEALTLYPITGGIIKFLKEKVKI
jgi:inosine/xanthosine triphosphate pyrophosphatase family protein